VAANTTVVGIPARPVEERLGRKPRFDAYGTPTDCDLDPLLHDLDLMRAEMAELEGRVARLARMPAAE
jgi:serine O-acetyltransferase